MTLVRLCALFSLLVVMAAAPAKAADKPDPFRPAAIKTNNVEVVPQYVVDRLKQYQNVRSASFAGWSPDGRGILIQTRFGNTAQMHRVYVPLGYRRQLTYFKEPVGGRFIPGNKRGNLLLSKSAGGSEQNQIYYFNAATGREVLLTDGKSRNGLGPVLKDGSRMIFTSNKRNGRDTDMYMLELNKPRSEPKMILKTDKEYWYPVDWSPDRFTVLINRYVSINETYPALLDIVTGKKTMIPFPGNEKKAAFGAMAFAPDGKSIYVATDAGGEFRQLARVDLKTFQYTWLSPKIPWDVTSIEVDHKSGLVAFRVNENGASALYFLGDVPQDETKTLFPGGDSFILENNKPVRFKTPLGIIGSMEFSPDGKQFGFTLSRPDAPADAFSIDMNTGKARQWTESEVGGLDTSRFIRPQQIFYKTFDRIEVPVPPSEDETPDETEDPDKKPKKPKTVKVYRSIPAYYFKPANATEENARRGRDQHPRRPREPVPTVPVGVRPVPVERTRHRRCPAQRPWFRRIWQVLRATRQRRVARRQRQGHREAARLGQGPAGTRPQARRGDGRFLRRLHGARLAHALQQTHQVRDRHRGHRELCNVSEEHVGLSP